MKISIISPHFNDFKGIKYIHECLKKQTSHSWEWIIVDDYSDDYVKGLLKTYFKENGSVNIQLVFNTIKTNASVCRNIGVEKSLNNTLVFLDADDIISDDFVSNRLIEVNDFVVFKNFDMKDKKGGIKPFPTVSSDFLNHFLQAKFIWQTTCVLWNKNFFIEIGKFDTHLTLLEDIELSIRALILSKNYKVIDNSVDFYYCVAPINIEKRPVAMICSAVDYVIHKMRNNYALDQQQSVLVKGYYYLCVRYYNRSSNKKDIRFVQKSLKRFYKNNYISYFNYLSGLTFIKLHQSNLISDDLFLRLNRYFYK